MVEDYLVVYSRGGDCSLTKSFPSTGDFSQVMVKAGSAVGEAYIAVRAWITDCRLKLEFRMTLVVTTNLCAQCSARTPVSL